MTDGNSVSRHPAIVRVEERLKNQGQTLERLEQLIKDENAETRLELETHYVRSEIFEPVRLVVYGLVGMTLMGVLTAVIALVLRG